MEIIKTYAPSEQQLIADIFSRIFVLCSSVTYDDGVFDDYLGELFMKCNQGNKNAGQYFTPFHVSKLIAKMSFTKADIEQNKIITINDCCSGGGGLLLAALDVLKNDYGVNYAYNCYIDAGDIDARCVHMTYLQLSLAGVPAISCKSSRICFNVINYLSLLNGAKPLGGLQYVLKMLSSVCLSSPTKSLLSRFNNSDCLSVK